MRKRGTEARWTLGTFNGIGLEISGYEALNTDCRPYLCTVILIQHHGENREFEVTDKTRPGTVDGRIDYSIRNLDIDLDTVRARSEEHTSELQSPMLTSYA